MNREIGDGQVGLQHATVPPPARRSAGGPPRSGIIEVTWRQAVVVDLCLAEVMPVGRSSRGVEEDDVNAEASRGQR